MQILDKITHVIPSGPKTVRGSASFLQASPNYLLYFNGCTVFLRPYDNGPTLFINHMSLVTAAKFSYGYNKVASIDQKGNLMIHEVAGAKICHNQTFQLFYAGAKSIDWTSDNKRLCVVGSAKNKYGRVIAIQTGTDVGQISAVTANLNSCSFRPQRPYKLAVGGDEFTMKFYQGPPFKFISSKKSHKNFINQIKYSPDGNKIVSVGSDRKITVYDGLNLQILKQKEDAHAGGVMGISWIDNQTFVTCSSDKKLKKWNLSLQLLGEIDSTANPAELSLIDSFIVAVSYNVERSSIYILLLSGQIKQVDKNLQKITNSYQGCTNYPNKIIPIASQQGKAIILDSNGKILKINNENSSIHRYLRKNLCHNKLLLDACLSSSGTIHYVSGDQIVYTTNLQQSQQTSKIQPFKIEGIRFITPVQNNKKSISFICYKSNSIQIYQQQDNKYVKVASTKLSFQPTVVYSCDYKFKQNQELSSCDLVLVGSMKGFVQGFIVEINQGSVKIQKKLEFHANQNRISYITKYQDIVFTGDSAGAIKVWKLVQSLKQIPDLVSSSLCTHRSSISSVLVKNNIIYTFSMDNSYSIWNLKKYSRIKTFQNIHKHGIRHAQFVGDKIVTCGGDHLIKIHLI